MLSLIFSGNTDDNKKGGFKNVVSLFYFKYCTN